MTVTFNTLRGHVLMYRYASLVEDAEFERLQRLMDEAERKDTLVQKLDSVSKLEVREDAGGGGGGGGMLSLSGCSALWTRLRGRTHWCRSLTALAS